MPMLRLGETASKTPYHDFICGPGCGKRLGDHFLFRPEKMADVVKTDRPGRSPDGKLYCHRDQAGYAGSYYQRQLRRTMVEGYARNS